MHEFIELMGHYSYLQLSKCIFIYYILILLSARIIELFFTQKYSNLIKIIGKIIVGKFSTRINPEEESENFE